MCHSADQSWMQAQDQVEEDFNLNFFFRHRVGAN